MKNYLSKVMIMSAFFEFGQSQARAQDKSNIDIVKTNSMADTKVVRLTFTGPLTFLYMQPIPKIGDQNILRLDIKSIFSEGIIGSLAYSRGSPSLAAYDSLDLKGIIDLRTKFYDDLHKYSLSLSSYSEHISQSYTQLDERYNFEVRARQSVKDLNAILGDRPAKIQIRKPQQLQGEGKFKVILDITTYANKQRNEWLRRAGSILEAAIQKRDWQVYGATLENLYDLRNKAGEPGDVDAVLSRHHSEGILNSSPFTRIARALSNVNGVSLNDETLAYNQLSLIGLLQSVDKETIARGFMLMSVNRQNDCLLSLNAIVEATYRQQTQQIESWLQSCGQLDVNTINQSAADILKQIEEIQ